FRPLRFPNVGVRQEHGSGRSPELPLGVLRSLLHSQVAVSYQHFQRVLDLLHLVQGRGPPYRLVCLSLTELVLLGTANPAQELPGTLYAVIRAHLKLDRQGMIDKIAADGDSPLDAARRDRLRP